MINYTIKGRHVVIDPATLTVRAFNDIWEYDKTDKKSLATELLTYLFNMYDERELNPFRDAEWDRKESMIKKNAFGDENRKFSQEERDLLEAGRQWFIELNSNAIIRLSRAASVSMDRVAQYLETQEVTSMEQVKAVMDQLKVISAIVKGKKEVDKEAKEEMDKTRIKGGGRRSLNSQGLI